MLNPDITALLMDADIGGGQPFVIKRRTKQRIKGRLSENESVQTINARGTLQPAGDDALQQLPEADRSGEVLIVRSTTMMQMGSTNESGDLLSDEIIYRGSRYKVLRVKDWGAWGMYVAFATRIYAEGSG